MTDKTIDIKFTKNPEFNFVIDNTKHSGSFDKNHPKMFDSLLSTAKQPAKQK